jgi:hypothetical protein
MNLSNKIDATANVVTIAASVLLSAVLIKAYLAPDLGTRRPTAIPMVNAEAGTSLKDRIPGVDWKRNGKTLVLAISTRCHFCTESAPFYRRVQEEAGKGVKIVAVLPQSTSESEEYLKGEGVRVDQVRQVELGNIGVAGTPTMLLVNSGGVVTRLWSGKVQPEEEDTVLKALKG